MDMHGIAAFFASADTKFYLAVMGAVWAASRGFTWVKDIRDKDLKSVQNGVDEVSSEVRQQTSVIGTGFTTLSTIMDRGFQELRSDFRTFYTQPDPIMVPVHARSTRKRKSTATRLTAKSSPPAKAKVTKPRKVK